MPVWLNLPNLLTASRLVLAVPVVWMIVSGQRALALLLFLAAGVTDVLDGAAARRLSSTTAVGAWFDPIADKLLVSAVFLALAWAGIVPTWFVALVLGRDVMILAGAAALRAATGLAKFPPSRLGKLSTFFQLGCAVMHMVPNAWPHPAMGLLAEVSLVISTVFTVLSGGDYLRRGVELLRRSQH